MWFSRLREEHSECFLHVMMMMMMMMISNSTIHQFIHHHASNAILQNPFNSVFCIIRKTPLERFCFVLFCFVLFFAWSASSWCIYTVTGSPRRGKILSITSIPPTYAFYFKQQEQARSFLGLSRGFSCFRPISSVLLKIDI